VDVDVVILFLNTRWSGFDDVAAACVDRFASVDMGDASTELPMKLSSDGDKLAHTEFHSSSTYSGYVCYVHDLFHKTKNIFARSLFKNLV